MATPPPKKRRLLTLVRAAEVLGVSPATVVQYIQRGQFPAYRIGVDRRYRVDANDLDAYLDARRVQFPDGGDAA